MLEKYIKMTKERIKKICMVEKTGAWGINNFISFRLVIIINLHIHVAQEEGFEF